jgi:hypothetical protein
MNTKKRSHTRSTKNDSFAKRAGDAIERVGDSVSEKGFPKAGKAIRNLGDKIEHSQDKATR